MTSEHEMDARLEAWLAEVMSAVSQSFDRDTAAELETDLRARVADEATRHPGDVDGALAALGSASAFAARLVAGGVDEGAPTGAAAEAAHASEKAKGLEGTILGVPYGLAPFDAGKIASRMWNPSDPRLLVPRLWGAGWDLNFGALAVKLRLIRPDDEEPVPFTNVPDRTLAFSALLPLAMLVAMALVSWPMLAVPAAAQVPIHWNLSAPDQFARPLVVAWTMPIPVGVLVLVVLALVFGLKRSRTARALGVALSTFMAGLGLGLWGESVWYATHGRVLVPVWMPIVLGLVVTLAVLVWLSRAGTRQEWKRDIGAGGGPRDREA